ncbi:hypothetical protein F5X68DRAFT_53396 [Plectosphaerella plurivora]|uniref:DUF6594 domain-containing protein n=1 Tax=Plectosphaerella plurivora TaxID=936078 RepID=A0A9P9A5M3_9PEZI|nr:hypothetical protein F5X68DRAFT_53396 [Plectosphaerella plurivora]
MPPSYQAPSVESVVGEPLDLEQDHHTPPSTATKEDFPLSKAHEAPTHEPLTTNDDTSNDEAPDETHVETDSTAMVLSPPLIEDPHDEPSIPDHRVPRELRTDYGDVIRAPSPSVVSDISGLTSRSAGSSGSGSTVTRRAHAGRRGGERHRNGDRPHTDTIPEHHHGETTPRPLQAPWHEPAYSDVGRHQVPPPHFLEQQQQHHQQTRGWTLANAPGHRHSTTRSVSSAGSSSLGSTPFSTLGHATDGSLSSPDRSEPADSPESRYAYRDQHPYSGPAHAPQHSIDPFQFIEHPFPNGPGPHQQQLSAPPHLAQQPSPGFHEHFQHPRPDNLPPRTGYEQLASWLSVNESGSPAIQPMYRRFEILNHRLLLHLQDELMELEEELRRLDAADSQNRHAPGGFHPASRRKEAMGGGPAGELYFRKTEVFNMIGFKMEKYNQLLSSFGETQSLQSPDPADVDAYRDYLITHGPIVQTETHFLDAEEDLVSLSRACPANDFNSENLPTPMPRRAITFPPTPTSPVSEAGSRVGQRQRGRGPVPRKRDEVKPLGALPLLAGGLAASFFLPIMAFVLIPAFVGRLAVVFLMTVVTGVALLQTGALRHLNGPGASGGATDVVVCAGVYGAVMAVLAVLL